MLEGMRRSFFLTQLRWILALLSLAASIAIAQTADPLNYSGVWMLSPAQSDYGPVPAPDLMIRTVKHSDGVIQMSTRQSGASGEVTSELRYTTDGSPSTNGENVGTASWEGGKLVIESGRQVQGIMIRSRETWSLSPDGQTLTIDGHISIPAQGEYDVRQVFVKAPTL